MNPTGCATRPDALVGVDDLVGEITLRQLVPRRQPGLPTPDDQRLHVLTSGLAGHAIHPNQPIAAGKIPGIDPAPPIL